MIFETLKQKLKEAIVNLNVTADHQDRWENGKYYGEVETLSMMIEQMGHKVDGRTTKNRDEKTVHIIYMTLDGEKIGELQHDVPED